MSLPGLDALACPLCRTPLGADGDPVRGVRCASGHAFDRARQGYLSLLAGRHRHRGDDAAMVGHRADFLASGAYAPLAEALVRAATTGHDTGGAPLPEGVLLDVGGGTGWYAAHALDALPERAGITLDASPAAARRAARAHPRLTSIVADAWASYPLADHAVALATCIFAPRNGAEFARVLAPGGRLVVVTPGAEHLRELREALDLLDVDPAKQDRLTATLAGHLVEAGHEDVRGTLALTRGQVRDLVFMGPNAHHVEGAVLAERLASLPEPYAAQLDVRVSCFAPPAP